jgi:glucose-like phosphotransferase system IIB component
MLTKADYLASKNKVQAGGRSERVAELAGHLGGLNNLQNIDACITRLRLNVKDRSKVNDAALRNMGAAGVVGNGTNVQVIFGAEADIFKTELKNLIKSGASISATAKKAPAKKAPVKKAAPAKKPAAKKPVAKKAPAKKAPAKKK